MTFNRLTCGLTPANLEGEGSEKTWPPASQVLCHVDGTRKLQPGSASRLHLAYVQAKYTRFYLDFFKFNEDEALLLMVRCVMACLMQRHHFRCGLAPLCVLRVKKGIHDIDL